MIYAKIKGIICNIKCTCRGLLRCMLPNAACTDARKANDNIPNVATNRDTDSMYTIESRISVIELSQQVSIG